jgi:uncharacterized DUF497 family protein
MGRTVISEDGFFEWDDEKDFINEFKHGLSFVEILTLFVDPYLLEFYDENHSSFNEHRFIGIGVMYGTLMITACYTERKSRIRIISTRESTKNEEVLYAEKIKELISKEN